MDPSKPQKPPKPQKPQVILCFGDEIWEAQAPSPGSPGALPPPNPISEGSSIEPKKERAAFEDDQFQSHSFERISGADCCGQIVANEHGDLAILPFPHDDEELF